MRYFQFWNEPLSVRVGLTFVDDFVLGKLPYSHCFLWNKIQMPKLKLLHKVKMDVCFYLQQMHKLMTLIFVMCFHSYALFQHERMA